jgi:ectoine hydroxylase
VASVLGEPAAQARDKLIDQFEHDGYLVIEDALSPDLVGELVEAIERAWRRHSPEGTPLNLDGILGEDERFLQLVDWPATFPIVYGVLGWNIYLYYTQLRVHPPLAPDASTPPYAWHQDGRRLVHDLETHPRARLSLKVSYWLTDASQPESGSMRILPGSHLRPGRPEPDEEGIPLRLPPGTAVIHDRRIWHARGHNRSDVTRMALFYGYGFRWLRQRDPVRELPVDVDSLDPVRRQLLDLPVPTSGHTHYVPEPDDVPLRSVVEGAAAG